MSIARARGPGEPDLACDLVAASIVEEYLRRDSSARLNIRVCGGYGALFVAGEVLSKADFDVSGVVRRTLSTNGILASIEPFVALESMTPADAPEIGSKDVVSVFGYATHETPELLPRCVVEARQLAQLLEERRTTDAEWFWLGADFSVIVDRTADPRIIVRLEHMDQSSLSDIRERISVLFASRNGSTTVQVNLAGEELRMGIKSRIGSSGRASSMDQYGSKLPGNLSGVGYHPRHPLQVGAALARRVACDLVAAGQGKAVTVHATWLPLEARPCEVRVRNERGEDLSSRVDRDRFDLTKIPEAYAASAIASAVVRAQFDRLVVLPWENG